MTPSQTPHVGESLRISLADLWDTELGKMDDAVVVVTVAGPSSAPVPGPVQHETGSNHYWVDVVPTEAGNHVVRVQATSGTTVYREKRVVGIEAWP